ncbi:hypothetical protein A8M60_11705 [Nocardia farcinica]|nr:hypothetical protein A8M60_11705 [Nocardia farcinica]
MPRAPVRRPDRHLVGLGEEADLRRGDTVADADDHDVAQCADDSHRGVDGRLQADEVEYRDGAVVSGDLPDIRHGVGIAENGLVGAHLACERKLVLAEVKGDDARRGQMA